VAEGGNLNKWFVGVFVFFGVFALLTATIPGLFQSLGVTTSIQDKETIETFTAHNITVYNNTLSVNLTHGSEAFSNYGLPSPQRLHFWWGAYPYYDVIGITHQKQQAFGGWWWDWERLHVQQPYASDLQDPTVTFYLQEEDVVTNLWNSEVNGSYVEMASSQITLNLIIQPRFVNQTMQQAWNNGTVTIYTSYTIDYTKTGESMWNILFQLLTFSNPDLGIAGLFGAILGHGLSLFLWASIGVIAFAIFTSVIPTVAGWKG